MFFQSRFGLLGSFLYSKLFQHFSQWSFLYTIFFKFLENYIFHDFSLTPTFFQYLFSIFLICFLFLSLDGARCTIVTFLGFQHFSQWSFWFTIFFKYLENTIFFHDFSLTPHLLSTFVFLCPYLFLLSVTRWRYMYHHATFLDSVSFPLPFLT